MTVVLILHIPCQPRLISHGSTEARVGLVAVWANSAKMVFIIAKSEGQPRDDLEWD